MYDLNSHKTKKRNQINEEHGLEFKCDLHTGQNNVKRRLNIIIEKHSCFVY